MSTKFSKEYLFKLADETSHPALNAFKNADLRYVGAAQHAYESAKAAEEVADAKEDASDAALEAIEAELKEVLEKEIFLREKLASAKATCEIDSNNWQKASESLTRADEACDAAENEARRAYHLACITADGILKQRTARAAYQERLKLLREKIAELEQGASSAESGAESGASPASAAASPLAGPSEATELKRLIRQGRKRLPAATKKWKLKVQRELLPDWKVEIIVRKKGANAGAHILKFTARNGKKFDSFVKAKAYDLKLRGTPRPEIRV